MSSLPITPGFDYQNLSRDQCWQTDEDLRLSLVRVNMNISDKNVYITQWLQIEEEV